MSRVGSLLLKRITLHGKESGLEFGNRGSTAFVKTTVIASFDGVGSITMMTPQTVLGYVKAEPFRPFRIHMASGRTFDVRHPELIKVLKSSALVFKVDSEDFDLPEEWESLSLMLAESLSHLEVSAR